MPVSPKRRGSAGGSARAKSKIGLVSFLDRPIDSIRPSPANDKLYRPVSANDPEIIALAKSIQANGLLQPLIITQDDVILSGHRRYVACRLAGMKVVPCRIEALRSTDPEFLTRLREYNRQRVKSMDEIAREELLSADPEEGYRVLMEYRKQRARVSTETVRIRGMKWRSEITKAKESMLQAIRAILEARRAFWPLTDRQIHYALLNNPPLVHGSKPDSTYQNTQRCYKATCELLTRARLVGLIPFAAIDDPTRHPGLAYLPRADAVFA